MIHLLTRTRTAALLAVVPMLAIGGCVTRGYPTHGGGKRFFQEQAIVAGSIDAALNQLDWQKLADEVNPDKMPNSSVRVHVYTMAHSGGGVQSNSSTFLGGLLNSVPFFGGISALAGNQPSSSGGPVIVPVGSGAQSPQGSYQSFGFESADDVRYLMGRVVSKLGDVGLQAVTPPALDPKQPSLQILVSQLGIDQSDFSALIYNEKLLRARTRVEAFLISTKKNLDDQEETTVTALGAGTGTMRFREDFVFGFGPISGGTPELEDEEEMR